MEVRHGDPFQGRAETSSGVGHVLIVGPVIIGSLTGWGEPVFERNLSVRWPGPRDECQYDVDMIGVFEGVWFTGARCCSSWSRVLMEVVDFDAPVLFSLGRCTGSRLGVVRAAPAQNIL